MSTEGKHRQYLPVLMQLKFPEGYERALWREAHLWAKCGNKDL